jgi:hypothetical protein
MVHMRSASRPAAELEPNGRPLNLPVGTGVRHRASENWIAVPFPFPPTPIPLSRADPAGYPGLENRYGLSVHRGFESPLSVSAVGGDGLTAVGLTDVLRFKARLPSPNRPVNVR